MTGVTWMVGLCLTVRKNDMCIVTRPEMTPASACGSSTQRRRLVTLDEWKHLQELMETWEIKAEVEAREPDSDPQPPYDRTEDRS